MDYRCTPEIDHLVISCSLAVIRFHPLENLPTLTSENAAIPRSIGGVGSSDQPVGLTNERTGRTLRIVKLWKQADGLKTALDLTGSAFD